MLPIWLMGVACYKICTTRHIPPRLALDISDRCQPIILAVYEAMPKALSQPFRGGRASTRTGCWVTGQDYFLGAIVFDSSDRLPQRLPRRILHGFPATPASIRWLAGGTFSLYLMHLPLLFMLAAASPFAKSSLANLAYLLTLYRLCCVTDLHKSPSASKKSWHDWIENSG